MSDIWQWIQRKHFDAMTSGEDAQIEMIETFWRMLDTMEDNPEIALTYCAQARQLAQMLDEKWFEQLLNHWELQLRYSFLGDYTGTLEIVTKATVEVRKPEYNTFPQRICLHEDLISAYVQEDPIGNRDLIQNALDYMEQEVVPSVECYICLNSLTLNFTHAISTAQDAINAGLQALAVAEGSEHHLSFIYMMLTECAYETKQWDKLLTWAIEAESNSRKAGRDNYIATAMIWLALHSQRTGDINRATSLFQQAEHRANRYGAFLGKAYFTAVTAYHETGGRLEDALAAQQAYLALVLDKSKYFSESLTYLEIIRLKQALAQTVDDDIIALKQTITHLKAPDYVMGKLDKILADG